MPKANGFRMNNRAREGVKNSKRSKPALSSTAYAISKCKEPKTSVPEAPCPTVRQCANCLHSQTPKFDLQVSLFTMVKAS